MSDYIIKSFSIKNSNYSISNCINTNANFNLRKFNISINESLASIDLTQNSDIYTKNSKIYTNQYNESIFLSENNEYNLPLIYSNIRNTINTRYV